jgi:hypothetical protein
MKIKALVSFSGAFSMYKGEIKECSDNAILQDLLQAGYVEEVTEKATKGGNKNEGKRNNSK